MLAVSSRVEKQLFHTMQIQNHTGSDRNRENAISVIGFGQVGLESFDASSQIKESLTIAAAEPSQQLPVQPVSERFPALEEQEIIFTFFAPARVGEVA